MHQLIYLFNHFLFKNILFEWLNKNGDLFLLVTNDYTIKYCYIHEQTLNSIWEKLMKRIIHEAFHFKKYFENLLAFCLPEMDFVSKWIKIFFGKYWKTILAYIYSQLINVSVQKNDAFYLNISELFLESVSFPASLLTTYSSFPLKQLKLHKVFYDFINYHSLKIKHSASLYSSVIPQHPINPSKISV